MLSQIKTKEEKEWRDYMYQQSLADMATLYSKAGDYQTELEYINLGTLWYC